MMSLALVVLGMFSYRDLGVDLMPRTESPTVNIMVRLNGASPEETENQITKPIEETINSIDGIDELRTNSGQGNSNTTITFNLEKDIKVAIQDVRDKVAPMLGRFPRDTQPPQVTKADPDSAPILMLAVYGDRDPKELTQIVDEQIKQQLESASGVASIQFFGDRRRNIQLLVDADRLNAYGLTIDQVRNAINRQNIEIPGGNFTTGSSEYSMRTMGRITEVKDFSRIILTQRDGQTITFGDIGYVADAVQEIRNITRVDGQPSVSLSIVKQTGSNTVAVVDEVMKRMEKLRPTLPGDIKIAVRRDQSIFIRKSIEDIQHHLIYGSILASIVVFFFLRNFRTTVIAAIAIPVSLIGTFIIMKMIDMTLNNMTLLALSLATGIVIDDAIVVLENIFRYVEEKGVTPKQAAGEATAEIGTAVMATTLSLVVIFLPVAFITGQIGQYLLAFGIASASAILLSMFVSFTLTPALCSMWLRPTDAGGHQSKDRGVYAFIDRVYGHMLVWSLRHRFVMLMVAIVVSLSAFYIFPKMGTELVPEDDQSEFSVNVNLPPGTPFSLTEAYTRDIEPMLRQLPNVETVFTNINNNSASYFVDLVPIDKRKVTQQDMIRDVRNLMRQKFPALRTSVSGGTDISGASTAGGGGPGGGGPRGGGGPGGGGGNRLQMLIQGPDLDQIQEYVRDLVAKLKETPGFVEADSNFERSQQELRVVVNRARAADLGVSLDTLANNLRTLVAGEQATIYREGDRQYEVQLRLDEKFRDPAKLGELMISATGGGGGSAAAGALGATGLTGGGGNGGPRMVRVSDVADLRLGEGVNAISRYNRQRQVSVNAAFDNIPLGEAVTRARTAVDALDMKPGYAVVFGGSAKTLQSASNDFVLAMGLAVAFIYMVLASQFNSFIHPLTIMTALPLSLPAGLLALLLFGMTINVYSGIGMLMLFGIVKKNSILQVDYTNTLRERGVERHEAIIQANHVRLRPILMTTISIFAGMLPIAMGKGAGAGSRASMAVTIIGGQALCLLLTLLITPVAYSYFDDLREWRPSHLFARFRRRKTQHSEAAGD
jgi:hydrophobic/amphiphilic exporter-1 (mainly G- bacteria), HAE1 family